jgi:hypothetical protein
VEPLSGMVGPQQKLDIPAIVARFVRPIPALGHMALCYNDFWQKGA